jgi:hypothetical protein
MPRCAGLSACQEGTYGEFSALIELGMVVSMTTPDSILVMDFSVASGLPPEQPS